MKDLKKIQEFFSKPLKENTTNWPEEVPSRYGDIIFRLVKVMPDRAKYELIDAETGKTWEVGGRVYDTVNQLKASAENTIKPQGGRQSSQFESVNEEEKSFTDYDNKELAAYCKNNPTDKKAAAELHKRSQKLKNLSRTDVKEDMYGGDPLDQIFRQYAGKTIEMDFTDMDSDWAQLISDLEEHLPGDELVDAMSRGDFEPYLEDYNITLMEPIMDKDIDPDVIKRGKAKMDIDAMRKAGGLPPMDDIASLNEVVGGLSIGDTITPNMWDKQKIEMGIRGKAISDPFWFTKPHKIINFNSRLGMISFDHPADPKRSETWVNRFLKDEHQVNFSEYPEGELDVVYSKGRMSEGEDEVQNSFTKILDLLKKESRALNDDDSYALGLKLKEWFSKNILDESLNERRDITKVKRGDIITHDETGKEYKVQDLIGKVHRLQSNKLQVVDTEGNVRVINPYKYSIKEPVKENKPVANPNRHIKGIQIQLDQLGVKYEMDPKNKVQPFKAIYKPVNKDDEWYDNFDDIVFRYNLKDVVKTSMNEANGFKSGKEFINIKLRNYPKAVAKINQLIDMIGEPNFTMEMAEWIFDFFNNASFESPVNEAKVDYDFSERELIRVIRQLKRGASTEIDMIKAFTKALGRDITKDELFSEAISKMNEASKEEETEFHKKLDKLVHDTFGKRKGELEEAELNEASVPSNIRDFAKRKGVSSLVNKVTGWAEKVGKKIVGGTAIGYNYSTLILDMTYQGSEIRIDTEDETVELFDKPVKSFNDFKRVYNEYKEEDNLEQLSEAKYSEYADLIDLVQKADNPRNLPIYYNSDFGAVNIGGVGYDKGELVDKFNGRKSGMDSIDIKTIFFKANQNPEQTAKDVNSLNMGVKAEVDYGYGKEPFIKFTKGYSDDFLDQEMKTQMSNDEETLRRERGLEERISEALTKINEELCPAGKAYIKKRKAAGEKSSAYLSGRAVKVCKGQMSGKAKKKTNESLVNEGQKINQNLDNLLNKIKKDFNIDNE